MMISTSCPDTGRSRHGFTLVELLIVITIIVIILGMTLATIDYSRNGDKVSAGARQVQSFLAGARNRAMYADEIRGVRLFLEQDLGPAGAATRTVTTMAYIAPGGYWAAPKDSSQIYLERSDGNGDGDFDDEDFDHVNIIRGIDNPGWWNLKRRGMLFDGMRIRIPAGTGDWYPISVGNDTTNPTLDITVAPPDEQILFLQIPFANAGNSSSNPQRIPGTYTYEIELPTRLLPQDPAILPEDVVIDLDGSKVPASWRPSPSTGFVHSGYMDILFSPRGNIIGDAAGSGVMHLYLCDREDSLFLKEEWLANSGLALESWVASNNYFIPLDVLNGGEYGGSSPAGQYIVKDRRLVSLFTQTGVIKSFQVNAFEGSAVLPGNPGFAGDPFYFAETGEVVK